MKNKNIIIAAVLIGGYYAWKKGLFNSLFGDKSTENDAKTPSNIPSPTDILPIQKLDENYNPVSPVTPVVNPGGPILTPKVEPTKGATPFLTNKINTLRSSL